MLPMESGMDFVCKKGDKIGKLTVSMVYIIVVVSLGITTFLSPMVYGSLWFILLWVFFAAVLVVSICGTGMWRRGGSFLLHISFIAILGGGLMTYLTQEKGMVRIMPGEEVTSFITVSGNRIDLPRGIRLERFEIKYYPGGTVPSDYVSHLIVEGRERIVSMNNILEVDGYRFLQASYDSDGGTVLSVNHDPYGIPLSYTGYLMFAAGGLWVMLPKRGNFRRLLAHMGIVMVFAGCCQEVMAAGTSGMKASGISREVADSLRGKQVLYGGRVVTFNTLARDVVTKIYGKAKFRGLTAEQTLVSFKLFPEEWKDQPLIYVRSKSVAQALGIEGKYVSLSDLFDTLGNYRVTPLYMSLGERERRGVEELDEKVGILLTLMSGELIVSSEGEGEVLSPSRVRLELFYNSVPLGTFIFVSLFSGFVISGLTLLTEGKWERRGRSVALGLLIIAVIGSLFNFGCQWILSGRLPLANTYETLEFVVLVIELIVMLIPGRNRMLLPLGMLFAGALALVAHLVEVNPVVTPLMPVLHSPWLSLHVSLVMTSYAMLGFTFIIALTGLLRRSSEDNLRNMSMALLYPGVWLLGLGIFTGAIWANVSWGEYWSWDPKETWALVTMLVYALPLHGGWMGIFRSRRGFHGYLLFAVLSIAMTYFGVNYLDSMHAYN